MANATSRWIGLGALALALCAGAPARAEDVVITVGGDKAAGKALGTWAKSLTKAFSAASQALATGGPVTVVVKVAAGDHDGDLGSGAYELPSLRNAQGTLRLEGGYSPDFSARDPFGTPTRVVTNPKRSLSLWQFFNSRPTDQDVLASLVIDGFLMDVAGSNNYDARSNSLLFRGSSTNPVIRFSNLQVDRFELKNCVFMNSPHRVFETLIRPGSDKSTLLLYNCVFLNCVIPLKLVHALTRDCMFESFELDHCSFLLCWPANPDPNTGNPAAVEISDKKYARRVRLAGNLFYANFGAALMLLGGTGAGSPKLDLVGNDFVGNGLLFGKSGAGDGAFMVEAGGRMNPIDIETAEELDCVNEFEGNVSIPPGIPLELGSVTTVDASKVKPDDSWQNDLNRLLGRPVQGGKVEVEGFAPRKEWDGKHPPFPTNPAAKQYGASPALVGKR